MFPYPNLFPRGLSLDSLKKKLVNKNRLVEKIFIIDEKTIYRQFFAVNSDRENRLRQLLATKTNVRVCD
jgi:hypothetical protein